MPNSSVAITPGAGANIAVNVAGGLDFQVIKLDFGADGASLPAVADGSGFLKVNVAAAATLIVNNPTAANLKVDASGATVPISAASAIPVSAVVASPVFVRLSDGTNPIATLPVSGTVTANQGTPAAIGNAWPIIVTDGTNQVALTNVGGNRALNVNVVQSVGPGALADKGAFTEGTTPVTPIAGEYNTAPTNPASGQVAAVQITQLRALHVNLRAAAGTEIGSAAAPLRIDPTGTTVQPVNHTQLLGAAVIAVAAGIQKVGISDGSGNAYTDANPLRVTPVPNPGTAWKQTITYTASTGSTNVRVTTGGKTSYLQKLIITPTGAGVLTLFDNADTATSELFSGSLPASGVFSIQYDPPVPMSAVANNLKYLTGSGAAGTFLAIGYEL